MLKVLIAEDDLLIAVLAEQVLNENGYAVCGIARTVSDAIALGMLHHPQLAIVDQRLAEDGLGTDIALGLSSLLGLGVLYTTGNSATVTCAGGRGHACLAKPYRTEDLLRGLDIVAGLVATGAALPPFPRGFELLQAC